MSGVEVVSAIASISQLANYLLGSHSSIHQLFNRLREAPARSRQQTATLQEIVGITQAIRDNRWFQDERVAALLRQIIQLTDQAHSLLPNFNTSSLSRSQHLSNRWKAYQHLRKDERVLDGVFQELKDKKSSLALYLANIQIAQVGEAFSTGLTREESSVRECSAFAGKTWPSERDTEKVVVGHLYRNALATDRSCQINGDFASAQTPYTHHMYDSCVAQGASVQLNGNLNGVDLQTLARVTDGAAR